MNSSLNGPKQQMMLRWKQGTRKPFVSGPVSCYMFTNQFLFSGPEEAYISQTLTGEFRQCDTFCPIRCGKGGDVLHFQVEHKTIGVIPYSLYS